MQVKTEELNVSGQTWKQFTLQNDQGMEVSFLDFGGIITNILAPDKNNQLENVVLGYKNYEDYLDNPNFFGALVGRVAGRIQGAQFELEDNTYNVPVNENESHLHGGAPGFHKVIWGSKPFENSNEVGVKLSHFSPDGENGYPGNLKMNVTYALNNDNEFSITYEGDVDQTSVLTATNHSYFNLSGGLKDTILNHTITMDSSKFVELDEKLIPTGEILAVDGTVFDFREGRKIQDGTTSDHQQNAVAPDGYDHFFIFDDNQKEKITLEDEASGRKMTVTTEQPGVVMYTSNNLADGLELLEGSSKRYHGVCLETQASPASIHHEGFPSVIIQKDEKYAKKTTFAFGLIE
ncbi:aldose epimerase family protein [Aquibacillus albus]|uniref:Aldose 1-epimerase n=1 Tax=Aquibacillus albus TaxID=1168171 RepID=A0ABS2MXS0_9BACI|nr:aldose epimerase family protein [Aquibacillus albus]MBM7570631.1 aldose 1-epimerase [Aquibacillus albus]